MVSRETAPPVVEEIVTKSECADKHAAPQQISQATAVEDVIAKVTWFFAHQLAFGLVTAEGGDGE